MPDETPKPPKKRFAIFKPPDLKLQKNVTHDTVRRLVQRFMEFVKTSLWQNGSEATLVRRTRSELLTQCRHICINIITYRLQQNKCAKPAAMDALHEIRKKYPLNKYDSTKQNGGHSCEQNGGKNNISIPPTAKTDANCNDVSHSSTQNCTNASETNDVSDWAIQTERISSEMIHVVRLFDQLFPDIYKNICRKLNTTMRTEEVVTRTLTSIFNHLFRGDNSVTWAKLVSMMAVAAQVAVECVQQGHSPYVVAVVDVVATFTSLRLLDWVEKHSGWGGIHGVFNKPPETRISKYVVVAMTTAIIVAVHGVSLITGREV